MQQDRKASLLRRIGRILLIFAVLLLLGYGLLLLTLGFVQQSEIRKAQAKGTAVTVHITALEHSGSAGNDRSAFISDFERLACAHLSALTGGNYTKLQISPELTAAVEENGTMRGTGAFSSDTHSRIMLALKRAQLALQRELGSPWFSLVGSTPEIVTDRNRFG